MLPRNTAMLASPKKSKRRSSAKSGSSKSTKSQATTAANVPGMTLTRKSQCQEKSWVRYPPTVGPIVGASVTVRPTSAITIPCARLGKTV